MRYGKVLWLGPPERKNPIRQFYYKQEMLAAAMTKWKLDGVSRISNIKGALWMNFISHVLVRLCEEREREREREMHRVRSGKCCVSTVCVCV